MEDKQRFGVTEEEARGSMRCRRMICCGQHLKEEGFWSRSLTIFRSQFFFSLTLFHVQGYFQCVNVITAGWLKDLQILNFTAITYRTVNKKENIMQRSSMNENITCNFFPP